MSQLLNVKIYNQNSSKYLNNFFISYRKRLIELAIFMNYVFKKKHQSS